MRAAAGENEAGGNLRFEAGAAEFVADQHQQFLSARLDDFGEHAREHGARRAVADAGDFDGGVFGQQFAQGTGVLALDFFGFGMGVRRPTARSLVK